MNSFIEYAAGGLFGIPSDFNIADLTVTLEGHAILLSVASYLSKTDNLYLEISENTVAHFYMRQYFGNYILWQ